ncbi:hypothetical protein FRB93_013625 [Tulasnella sp. JGI-2019a]|nr:hypothetical protein FRB93_013625 [Tulasnella sp. JGI-2019a]
MVSRLLQPLLGFILAIPYTQAMPRPDHDNQPTNGSIPINTTHYNDPYLPFQPIFADSLPVQIMLTGICLAAVVVLLVHLIFTFKYHWPLARLNYALQLSGVVTLLISLISTSAVVLNATYQKSRTWPYMFEYIAIQIPLDSWSQTQLVMWYLLNATLSGLVNITHIQFLTLLYPSSVEARLIFFLLGPLAIVSAGMEFAALLETDEGEDLGQSIRDTCNSTLTLLFSAALFIWGFVINRKHAWRMDGGTAVFGAGALGLALISTVVNFVQITEEGLLWLPGLTWTLVQWQSFLGWWWWIGSGLGIGDVEDMLIYEQKKRDSRMRRSRKSKKRQRARQTSSGGDGEGEVDDQGNASSTTTKMMGRFKTGIMGVASQPGHYLSRRRTAAHASSEGEPGIELDRIPSSSHIAGRSDASSSSNVNDPSRLGPNDSDPRSSQIAVDTTRLAHTRTHTLETGSSASLSPSAPTSASSTINNTWLARILPIGYFTRLRNEHRSATQSQALQRLQANAESGGREWRLGESGLREREEAEERLREFEARRREGMLMRSSEDDGGGAETDDDGAGGGGESGGSWQAVGRRRTAPRTKMEQSSTLPVPVVGRTQPEPAWSQQISTGFWWWGPIRRWRLQDRTEY